jgi:hypothetical protein
MSRTSRAQAAREETVTEPGTEPALHPQAKTVRTIMEMVRAFPGMDCPAASRLFTEADQAYRDGAEAADTLGVFIAEVRSPTTGVLEGAARYRVRRMAHRLYLVTPGDEEPVGMIDRAEEQPDYSEREEEQ